MRTQSDPSTPRCETLPRSPSAQDETPPAKLAEQVQTEIHREFGGLSKRQPRLLQQALNEAAALAWQTDFPRLLFPTLALEKVESIARWEARQRSILQARRGRDLQHAA